MGSHYRTADFDYEFPTEAVAQHPISNRSASRLLLLDRSSGTIHHRMFRDFPSLLEPGDVLVRNTSRVVPARLTGTRENGREAEVLLVHAEPDGSWLAMVHPGGKLKVGRRLSFGSDAEAEIVDVVGGGMRRLRFQGRLSPTELMEHRGAVPLPPYIRRPPDPEDRERYQTVYASVAGSVAAPTAGLHFTNELFHTISQRGVTIVDIVLHVGPGTFKPVEVDDLRHHRMHGEWYTIDREAVDAINAARRNGRRIWAVGTTSARTLESRFDANLVSTGEGWTDLFIYPPYDFRIVAGLLTNFHLPRSTLLMLVAAFAGYDLTMTAYREALRQGYRFYSYGDAMAVM